MMDRAAIDKLLDEVKWEAIAVTPEHKQEELYATHVGRIAIGDRSLRVYQLNNGERVMDGEDIAKLFGVS